MISFFFFKKIYNDIIFIITNKKKSKNSRSSVNLLYDLHFFIIFNKISYILFMASLQSLDHLYKKYGTQLTF